MSNRIKGSKLEIWLAWVVRKQGWIHGNYSRVRLGRGSDFFRSHVIKNVPDCCYRNKAGYTATEVACGWAGAVMKNAHPSIWVGAVTQKPSVTPKKLTRMDRRTNHPTDITGYRVACTRLKTWSEEKTALKRDCRVSRQHDIVIDKLMRRWWMVMINLIKGRPMNCQWMADECLINGRWILRMHFWNNVFKM